MISYSKKITVESKHLDELDHVNNVVYLQWVQEISKEHWLSKTNKEVNTNYFWVVRSHHLEYKKQTFFGDELLVKTYVENYSGPLSVRVVEFYAGEKLVVVARSMWCLLDAGTKKPARVPEEIMNLF